MATLPLQVQVRSARRYIALAIDPAGRLRRQVVDNASMRDESLRRYWIEFEPLGEDEASEGVFLAGWSRAACGVTAHDFEDALALVRENLVLAGPLPTVRRVIEDVDLSTFEDDPFLAADVLPHVGPPIWRGVWFPSLWYTWES